MEASMFLSHFCENHGPCVMLTCQKLATSGPLDTASGASTASASTSSNPDPASSSDSSRPCSRSSSSRKRHKVPCDSCRSLDTGAAGGAGASDGVGAADKRRGFVTHDKRTGVTYMSSRQPRDANSRQLVKQACVRSLSGEICPQG